MGTLRTTRRGWRPSDERDFAPAALDTLARAGEDVSYLLDRGYPRESAITFVGDRHQLTRRQRLLLMRTASGEAARAARGEKRLGPERVSGQTVLVDGFNAVITLEVALSGAPVVMGQDGCARDLAGLRGTYHPIDKTPLAVGLLLDELERLGAARARFLFDEPVSNSGRACELVRRLGEGRQLLVEAETAPDVDGLLAGRENVVTSDSAVIDSCRSWLNLDAGIVRELARGESSDVWVIDIWRR